MWHLPVAETRTTRQIIDHVYGLAGHRPRCFAAGRTTLRLAGLVQPAMREYLHTLYQFTDRWVVDDTKFRTAFGDLATPLDDALATTFSWYRSARADRRQTRGRPTTPRSDPVTAPTTRRKDPSWTSRPPAEPPPRAWPRPPASPSPASPHSDRSSTTRRS